MSSISTSISRTNRLLPINSLRGPAVQTLRLLAIRKEGVTLATAAGLIDAQVVEILRIEHTAMFRRRRVGPARPMRRLPARSTSNVSRPTPSNPVMETPQTELPTERRQIRLRSVGEILTDQAGHFYEVRGQEFHMLGLLVKDEKGRFFEVCGSTSGRVSKGEENEHSERGTSTAADVQNLRAETESDKQLSETATRPTNRELQDTEGNTFAEPSSIGNRKPSSILARLVHWIFSDLPRRLTALADRKP